jgi:hypothetical protein
MTLAFWLAMAVVICAVASLSNDGRLRPLRERGNDIDLYRAIVQRVHAGQAYYPAHAAELVARGFPTRSVFNWRMPLPLALLGKLPDPIWGKFILAGLALLLEFTIFAAVVRDRPQRPLIALGAALLLTGPLLLCVVGDIYLMPVVWSGVLLALSLAAFGWGRPFLGAAAGIAALWVRELALPYCLLGLALAVMERRWRQTAVWLGGLCIWLALFVFHALHVVQVMPADAVSHAQGWIRFGGLPLLISMSQVNAYLLLLPRWLAGLYLAAALLGFSRWDTPWGLRAGLTAAGYVLMFAIVGQEFNQYWGCLIGPVLALGVAQAPRAIRDLIRESRTGPVPHPATARG